MLGVQCPAPGRGTRAAQAKLRIGGMRHGRSNRRGRPREQGRIIPMLAMSQEADGQDAAHIQPFKHGHATAYPNSKPAICMLDGTCQIKDQIKESCQDFGVGFSRPAFAGVFAATMGSQVSQSIDRPG